MAGKFSKEASGQDLHKRVVRATTVPCNPWEKYDETGFTKRWT
jgi:hypothetical protein